ncbi:MAG: M56 family metallopeptidase [Cyclobacteriaceae bacterium]
MTATLNYIIEANLGLLLVLAFYLLFLRKETGFKLLRTFLLTGIFASLIFPLIHIENNQEASPLSIGQVIPSYWLPEVVVGGESAEAVNSEASFNFWKYTSLIYSVGLGVFCLLVLFQLVELFRIIHRSTTYPLQKLRIAESSEDKPTFSFFHFIFIGKADQLSPGEKEQIIRHESVHARQWHSFDILLVNVLKVLFWFNPFIGTYKKIFIHLHEFEADARAVENSDVNKYCSLLAKVALQSADFSLANHFNNSLTVKRIEMMRTIKSNIKRWKLVAVIAMVPLVFFFVACQDQVGDDIMEIARNSTHALIIPEDVQNRFEDLKKENPEKNYAVLELNETASQRIESLRQQYGLPKSIEVFKVVDGKIVEAPVTGHSNAGVVLKRKSNMLDPSLTAAGPGIKIRRTEPEAEGHQTFAILEFNEETSKLAEASQEDKIFTVVEEQPEFPGGYDSMMVFIKQNLRYPTSARMQGIEGTVYVSFIVGKDGTVYDEKLIRGISPEADAEALRVMELSPAWIPGKQNKEAVSVRFVLPIKFRLNN